jgi:hypothetical protein
MLQLSIIVSVIGCILIVLIEVGFNYLKNK